MNVPTSASEVHALRIPGVGFLCAAIEAETMTGVWGSNRELLDSILLKSGFPARAYIRELMTWVAFQEGRDEYGFFGGEVRTFEGYQVESEDYTYSDEPLAQTSTYCRIGNAIIFRPIYLSELRMLLSYDPVLKLSEPLISIERDASSIWFQEMQGNLGWATNCDGVQIERNVRRFVFLDDVPLVLDSPLLRAILPENPLLLDV